MVEVKKMAAGKEGSSLVELRAHGSNEAGSDQRLLNTQ